MNIYRNVKQLNNKRYSDKLYFPCPKIASGEQVFGDGQPETTSSDGALCSRPLMVICETVNICCNNCVICPYGTMTRKKEVMSLELFKKLLVDYSAMGGGKLSLTPKMGDIFFDTRLLKRLELVRNYPKITGLSVTTNAIMADRFTDGELRGILSSFERVHISVYGLDPEEYTLMTRRDTYQRMGDNIRRILALAPRSCTIMLGFRLLRERSAAEIEAWILKNFSAKTPHDVTGTFMDWGGSLDASQPLPLDGKWRPARANASQCIIPLAACLVFSNGDVSFCSCNDYAIKEEFRLGSIAKNSLAEIINSPKNAKLWESPLNLPRSCKFCSSHRAFANLHAYAYVFEDPCEFIGG
jgi:MoaA/NifB/PqqE/SkfB family radical SAM enzyme